MEDGTELDQATDRPSHLPDRPSRLPDRPSHLPDRPSHLPDRPKKNGMITPANQIILRSSDQLLPTLGFVTDGNSGETGASWAPVQAG